MGPIINFSNKDNIVYTGDINTNGILNTFLKNYFLNFKIDYTEQVNGIIKLDNVQIGTFAYNGTGVEVTKTFNPGKMNEILLKDSQNFTIEITNPLLYTKNLKILFPKPTNTMRPNQVIAFVNNYEFSNSDSTSKIRNLNRLLNKVLPLNHFNNRFKYSKILEYFKTPGVLAIPGNPDQTKIHLITYNFDSTAIAYDMEIIDGVYWVATDKGIITSPDYENWTHITESGNEYISSIYYYTNYIAAGLLSKRVLLSKDKGLTWSIIDIGDAHISSVYITSISGTDYLFVGTQQGTVLKYNLNTSTLVYTKTNVANLTYIRDMVWFNNLLIVVGYKCIAYINDTGNVTEINPSSIGISSNEEYNYICITPNFIYAISSNYVIKTLDGINWSVETIAASMTGKTKTVMIYNPDRDEFIFGYDNDIKFGITKDFMNINYNETYKVNSSSNKIAKIIWDSTYGRYIILSSQLKLLNYVV